jgi:hypothetical protein
MAKFDLKTFNPQAFGKYVDTIPKVRLNELIKSRALQPNSQIKTAFSNQTGVVYATLPLFGRLDGDALNYDGETDITATSTTTYERGVVVIGRAKAWVERDFSEDITGGAGFMSNVARQVSEYWDGIDQDMVLAILDGIFSMTGTDNLKFVTGHTYDISTAADAASQVVGAATLNTAIQQASGDKKSKFSIVIMHSAVATNLENMKLLEYMKQTDANGIERQLALATWNGRTVLIDDGMPTVDVPAVGGDNPVPAYTKYTTYVLGNGAFDYENIGAEVPYEMNRDPKTNGGQTYLYTRQRKVFAPYGISFTKLAMVSNSPTNAELKTAANWTLVNDSNGKSIDHKSIPIARIISRG